MGKLEQGSRKYPRLFSRCTPWDFWGQEKPQGRRRMQQTWQHISGGAAAWFAAGPRHPARCLYAFPLPWNNVPMLLFSFMLSALLRQDYDPAPVLEIIRRTLY